MLTAIIILSITNLLFATMYFVACYHIGKQQN